MKYIKAGLLSPHSNPGSASPPTLKARIWLCASKDQGSAPREAQIASQVRTREAPGSKGAFRGESGAAKKGPATAAAESYPAETRGEWPPVTSLQSSQSLSPPADKAAPPLPPLPFYLGVRILPRRSPLGKPKPARPGRRRGGGERETRIGRVPSPTHPERDRFTPECLPRIGTIQPLVLSTDSREALQEAFFTQRPEPFSVGAKE